MSSATCMVPGQDYYHRLLDGELFLHHGDERLCSQLPRPPRNHRFEPRRFDAPSIPHWPISAAAFDDTTVMRGSPDPSPIEEGPQRFLSRKERRPWPLSHHLSASARPTMAAR